MINIRAKNTALLIFLLLAIQSLALPQDIYRVQRVVDGDTIVLDNGLKVRLIAIISAWIWFYYLIEHIIRMENTGS
jgi:hypothetical protein